MQTKQEVAARQKAWYEANKEEILAKQKAYQEANTEEKAAYQKVYREANKEELAAKAKAYNEANKGELASQQKVYKKAKRAERNLMLFNYKGAECSHCGLSEPDHLEIYDYHHVDPSTKLYAVAAILSGPIERLMNEVDKCILLCAHCHRKEHVRLNKEKLCR